MLRTLTIRPLLAAPVVAILIVAAFDTSARAQLTNGATFAGGNIGASPFVVSDSFNDQATDLSGANFDSLQVTDDWYLGMPKQGVSSGSVLVHGELPFTIGNIPVQASDFQVEYNAKWVNGGGTATNPFTTWTVTGFLKYETGATPDSSDPVVYQFGVTNSLTGNGYTIDTQSGPAPPPAAYVLGSNSNYYLQITVNTAVTIDNTFTNQNVPVVVTNEAGGTFGDSFSGFNVSFDWHTVPEPGSMTMAVVAAASLTAFALIARRRKTTTG